MNKMITVCWFTTAADNIVNSGEKVTLTEIRKNSNIVFNLQPNLIQYKPILINNKFNQYIYITVVLEDAPALYTPKKLMCYRL